MAQLVPKRKTRAESADMAFEAVVEEIAELAADKKVKDIRAYDVRGLTLVADAFVLCTATSEPQLKAVYGAVKDGLKEAGIACLRTEGTFQGGWLLVDFGSVIFHIFREEARKFYDLDGMWADAREMKLEIE